MIMFSNNDYVYDMYTSSYDYYSYVITIFIGD